VIRSMELENDITALTAKYETAMDSIRRLTSQLDDLTVAKEKHEEELLAKCVLLLNEKKSKVRNQQRLLATAKIDPTKSERNQSPNAVPR
jgi:peptidoglycan hydrolase CwlO-like protein